jgi:hypothetical protein
LLAGKLLKIAEPYKDSCITKLLCNIVAIGTWPTFEKLGISTDKVITKTRGSVAID